MTHLWEKMVKSLLVLHILSIYLIQNYLRTDKKMKKKVKEKKTTYQEVHFVVFALTP